MKIISVSHRRKHLTAVRFEDESELLLDTETVLTMELKPGVFIDDPDALLYESDLKRAKSRALWYLSRGDHSEKGLLDKLCRAGFSPEASSAAAERMIELGLIDDRRYARHLFENLSESGCSVREIYAKLINKGISSDIAKETVNEEPGDETDKIKALLDKKYSGKLDTEEGVQKVFAALVRKGFSFTDIKDALKAYSEELYYSEEQ